MQCSMGSFVNFKGFQWMDIHAYALTAGRIYRSLVYTCSDVCLSSGATNLEELNQKLTDNIMIRRLKSEVLQELPSKVRQKIPFEISQTGVKELQESFDVLKKMFKVLDGTAEPEATERHCTRFKANNLLNTMFCKSGEAKIPGILTYLRDFLEIVKQDVKFLVFAHHLVVQRAIAEMFVKENVGFVHIYGEVPARKRQEYVRQFQERPETRVALLSLKAANTGLNLSAATHVVFAELYWNPGDLIQAEDRCHRIGQHQSVHIHYLVGKSTLDELLWLMLCRKVAVTSTALNGKTDVLTAEVPATKDLREFISTYASWFLDQTNARCQPRSEGVERPKDAHRVSSLVGWLQSSTESHPAIHISDNDGDEQLLEMELHPLRQRRRDRGRRRCRMSAIRNTTDMPDECVQIADDKVHDSSRNEFREEKRNFRNCRRSVTRANESATSSSNSDSDSVFPVFSTSLAPQCADCQEPTNSTAMSWACDHCTFVNFARSAACEMCDTVRIPQGQEKNVEMEYRHCHGRCSFENGSSLVRHSSEWACERCTYFNAAGRSNCDMCHAARPPIECRGKTQTDAAEMEEDCQVEVNLLKRDVSCEDRACSSTLKACTGKESAVVVDSLVVGTETKAEQQQETRPSDNKMTHKYQATKREQTGCGSREMEAVELVGSGSETERNEQHRTEKDTVFTGTGGEAQTCCTDSNTSHNEMPFVVELVDTKSETENEFDSEADCVSATPDRLECGAGNITVIPETPPREQRRLSKDKAQTVEDDNSKCSIDIDEFLSDECEEKCADKVGALNTSFPSSSGDTVMSEAGWDDCLLEDIIGNEPDEWETETLTTACSATRGNVTVDCEAQGSASNITSPMKERQSNVQGSRDVVAASALIKHPDPLQRYCPPVAPQAPHDGHFMFYICHNTERIALYTNDGHYLQCTVSASDVLCPVDESLPPALQLKPNLQSVQCFVRDYVRLSVRDKALLKNHRCVIHDVSSALSLIKKNITKKQIYARVASKEKFNETAVIAATEAAGGQLLVVDQAVHPPFQKRKWRKRGSPGQQSTENNEALDNSTRSKRRKDSNEQLVQRDEVRQETEGKTRQYVQGVLADGQRICAACTKCFQPVVVPGCSEFSYGGRFCSRKCYKAFLVKTSRQAARAVVAEEEQGVCAICGLDTGDLLRKMKVLTDTGDRMQLLKQTGHFSELSDKLLWDIVERPKAGKLWHADHIVPVACGGGACPRENLRALCVPCHQKETKNVRKQARGRGCRDIRSCFSKGK